MLLMALVVHHFNLPRNTSMKRLPALSGNVKMKHMILIAVCMTSDQVTKGESSISLTCKHKVWMYNEV